MRPLVALLLGLLTLAPAATADRVTPSERVRSRLMVRAEARPGSRIVARLAKGEEVELLGSEGGWHRIELDGGKTGYVSAGWTRVIEEEEEEVVVEIPAETLSPASIPQARPSLFSGISRFFTGLFGKEPGVDFEIRDPEEKGGLYRHEDPELPVSGFARLQGGGRFYDVIVVIDASGSTNESAETDVDRDGGADQEWMGSDSIYRAQLSAAASFLRTVARLPENREGERIRVGIVRYGGANRFRLFPPDRDIDLTPETVLRLANRDAGVDLPLGSDYAEAERVLQKMWQETPTGMTDIAAGIGRAVIELNGDMERGALSEPNPQAQKVILFLTDGKPRLPYDKLQGERLATYAGKIAAESGVRIHAFALGRNAVTDSPNYASPRRNYSLKRMARRSGGRYVALETPAEIVSILNSTPLSEVERVQLVNHTTGRQSRHIATGIDGSFYGEIPLEEGENEIEVAAILDDDRRASERFTVQYVKGAPTRQLTDRLIRVRAENEALIERIHQDLSREIRRTRTEQERQLDVSVEH